MPATHEALHARHHADRRRRAERRDRRSPSRRPRRRAARASSAPMMMPGSVDASRAVLVRSRSRRPAPRRRAELVEAAARAGAPSTSTTALAAAGSTPRTTTPETLCPTAQHRLAVDERRRRDDAGDVAHRLRRPRRQSSIGAAVARPRTMCGLKPRMRSRRSSSKPVMTASTMLSVIDADHHADDRDHRDERDEGLARACARR